MTDTEQSPRILILGGTAEARALAAALAGRFGDEVAVTTSLAGRTLEPAPVAGGVRRGGFGGADGLARTLREAAVDIVVDATHPFAARISAHAATTCAAERVPLLTLARPAWQSAPGDDWRPVLDAHAAARLLPSVGSRVFLTIGRRDLVAFADLAATSFLVRLIEPPAAPVPLPQHELILARGPFAAADEAELMREHCIDVLVSKASGGDATAAKLAAARDLSVPVILIERPPHQPAGPLVQSVSAAVEWIARALDPRLDATPSPPDHGGMGRLISIVLTSVLAVSATVPALAQIGLLTSDPLLVAAYTGDTQETKRLLMRGKPPDTMDRNGRSALIWAAFAGHAETVEAIVAFGPRIDHTDDLRNSALYYAAELGHFDVVAALLAAGGDANGENDQGQTPLMAASRNGHVEVARLCIDASAEVNHTDYTGRTALDWARDARSPPTVRLLQDAGAR